MSMVTYPLNNIEYTAEDAELFHSTRTSGVYATDSFDYSVTGADNSIVIGTGIAWIKNRQFSGKVVAQKEPMSLDMGLPDPTYPRIDAVVIQFNSNKNATEIVVKNGAASSFPIAPEVVRTESLYELHLYHVRREAGSLSISAPNITDLRNNNAYCGLMSDSITQAVDFTLSKNGVAADAAAVGDALATKAPAGYVVAQYNPTSEANLEEILDTVVNGMANKTGRYYLLNDNQGVLWGGGTAIAFVYKRNTTTAITRISTNNYGGVELVKVVDGSVWQKIEWVNPPMELGAKYRTTERWQNKAVYTRLIEVGAFPTAGSSAWIPFGVDSGITKIIRVQGVTDVGQSVPYDGDGTRTAISGMLVEGKPWLVLSCATGSGNMTGRTCTAQVWYVK